MARLRRAVRRAALQDAHHRDGAARWDIVLDRIRQHHRDLPHGEDELRALVRLVVSEVNAMSADERRDELSELDPGTG